ncbi:MAG: DHH family phosphoesterase [Candidatus Doudnabacteria bacterium]|nr:DHH family phosphoesterase [Candidatus Doudnabacteria bacterium]
MSKQWRVKTLEIKNPEVLPEYPPLVIRLLALRGFTEPEAIRDFLNPDFGKLHDPFLFADMLMAVERILQALERKEKIFIYADYDADAITAAAVVYLALKKLGAVVDYYIPDRFSEGYGVNADAIKLIAERGGQLVITVDCGTNAVEEVALAKELGMDVIVTDHHEVTGELPEALAVINPKNPHDNYSFPFLTGVGVAFNLISNFQMAGRNGVWIY